MGGLNNPSPQVSPNMPVIPGIYPAAVNRDGGYYYSQLGVYAAAVNATMTANILYTVPFWVLTPESYDRIAIFVGTAGTGSCRLGIYDSTPSGKPNSLILDAGEVDISTTGIKAITIERTLSPGLYFLVVISNGTPTVNGASTTFGNLLGIGRTTNLTSIAMYYTQSVAYGALPSTFGTPTYIAGNQPSVWLRKV